MIQQSLSSRPAGYWDDMLSIGTPLSDPSGTLRVVMMDESQFAKMQAKYPSPGAPSQKPQGGPGTELKSMLKAIGITASPNCSCNARAKTMDEKGIAWCRENVSTIVDWLREEAKKRKLPFIRFPAQRLVLSAIDRAERKAAKTPASGA